MPIYEFYCPKCHVIFNFLARSANTTKQPDCPRCGRKKLERQVSRFAISKNLQESADEPDLPPGFDESKFEAAMESMAGEMDNVNEDDPRQMARMMRKLFESTGMPIGSRMEEAIAQLERGADPDALDEEFGDLFGEDANPFEDAESGSRAQRLAKRILPPGTDDNLYDL